MTPIPYPDLSVVRKFISAGDLAAAESHCRALLAQAGSADGWHLLASILFQQGKINDALACLEQAVPFQPENAEFWHSLGDMRRRVGDRAQAVEAYQQAARLAPANAQIVGDLGSMLCELGQYADAEKQLRQALRLQPDLTRVIRNFCILLRKQKRFEELEQLLRGEIAARPTNAEAFFQLGITLQEQARVDEAEAFLREAVRLRPESTETHNQLGTLHWGRREWDKGAQCFAQALTCDPSNARALSNLGLALHLDNRAAEAEHLLRRALEIEPGYGQAHYNLAMILLLQRRFAEGWAAHEFRTKPPERPDLFPHPFWDGRPLNGERVLLHCEQGRGDMIQFVRYGAFVKERGGKVVVGSPPALVPLLSTCPYVDEVCGGSPLPQFDLQIALLSLPLLAGTTEENIPGRVPFLHADPTLQEAWRSRLARRQGFKVGIAWQGATTYSFDQFRSIPLVAFAPLASVAGIELFSLQKGAGVEQLTAPEIRFNVTDLGSTLDQNTGAFEGTAAAMMNLDLVITSDTAIAHLAGALGVPVWVALGVVPNWRWLLERTDCPWYPSMRLFRQERIGDWGPVFQNMAEELREKLGTPSVGRLLLTEISAGELLDKISILEIKSRRIEDDSKLSNIRKELASLERTQAEFGFLRWTKAQEIMRELRAINEGLWDTEDALRDCERAKDFGERFVELARSVYQQNDARSEIKRRLNAMLGSALVEEKSYGTAAERERRK